MKISPDRDVIWEADVVEAQAAFKVMDKHRNHIYPDSVTQ